MAMNGKPKESRAERFAREDRESYAASRKKQAATRANDTRDITKLGAEPSAVPNDYTAPAPTKSKAEQLVAKLRPKNGKKPKGQTYF